MISGDPRLIKPSRNKLFILGALGVGGVACLVGAILVGIFVFSAWLGRPVIFGFDEGPTQPIAFPHTVHVQQLGLDCTFCHRNVTKSAAATIPAVGLCMTCHKTVGLGLPEVEKLRDTFAADRSINWVRVHRLPDHVHFIHEAHIKFFMERDGISASAVCATCHGDVGSMSKVKQVRSLKMGDCVDCHRDNDAPTDCTTCHY